MKLTFIKTIECGDFKVDYYKAKVDRKENYKHNGNERRKGNN